MSMDAAGPDAFRSATELAALIRSRRLSAVEVVSEHLERIDRFDDGLRSFVTVAAERALESAHQADDAMADPLFDPPPFHGVPIAIKDNVETEGIRTTYSSRAFEENVPAVDAAVVRRLRAAGFIVIGKANLPEFGILAVTESALNGVCRNPWDQDLSPGGSSGGSAAAVAAGLCPIAHGNDGGGSIRIPASCCGLVGLKPSRGRVSWGPRHGEFWGGLGVDGPIARTARDAAGALDAMAGAEVGDPYALPDPPEPFAVAVEVEPSLARVAFTTSLPNAAPLDPECGRAVTDAADLLGQAGHAVEEASPAWDDSLAFEMWTRIWQASIAYYGEVDHSLLEPLTRALARAGERTSSLEYLAAVDHLHGLARTVASFWRRYDLLLTPVLSVPAIPLDWYSRSGGSPWEQFLRDEALVPLSTALPNITGLPAISLPLSWSAESTPIGVQIIGPPAGEALLLQIAAQLERLQPWRRSQPKLSPSRAIEQRTGT